MNEKENTEPKWRIEELKINTDKIIRGDIDTEIELTDSSVKKHQEVLTEIHRLYIDKNTDYGNSFSKSFEEFGMLSPTIRITDKINRLKRLVQTDEQLVKDESVRDTVLDIAGYAVLTLMELDKEESK